MKGTKLDTQRLTDLFALQWFVRESHLQQLVDEVGARYELSGCARELKEDELNIFAAGDLDVLRRERWDDKL